MNLRKKRANSLPSFISHISEVSSITIGRNMNNYWLVLFLLLFVVMSSIGLPKDLQIKYGHYAI